MRQERGRAGEKEKGRGGERSRHREDFAVP